MKRPAATYREVGEAHGIASLQRLLHADHPGWTQGQCWAEAASIMRPAGEVEEQNLIELLKKSLEELRGKAACRSAPREE